MDLRRLRVGEWIAAISGIALIVSLFLPWWGAAGEWKLHPANLPEGEYFQSTVGPSVGTIDWSAWDVMSVTDVLLALLGVGGILVWVVVSWARNTAPGVAAEALLTPFALVMAIVCVVRVLNVPQPLEPLAALAGAGVEVEYGAWLGLAATFGVLVGVLVALRDERLSKDGRLTDQTGVPVAEPVHVETLPGPPAA